jgi:crotonobetainyl-CoA:carnitine CoA-transferase CaiB-like acyl-CoA transferase
MAEVFDDPQIRARAMQLDMGGIPGVRSPFVFSKAGLADPRPSPRLGQHDEEVRVSLAAR